MHGSCLLKRTCGLQDGLLKRTCGLRDRLLLGPSLELFKRCNHAQVQAWLDPRGWHRSTVAASVVGAAAGGAMAGPMGMSLGAKTGVLAIAAGGAIAGEGPTVLQPPIFWPFIREPPPPPPPNMVYMCLCPSQSSRSRQCWKVMHLLVICPQLESSLLGIVPLHTDPPTPTHPPPSPQTCCSLQPCRLPQEMVWQELSSDTPTLMILDLDGTGPRLK